MAKIELNGLQFYYEEEGKGHPLILISGFTTDLSAWALIRKELASHYHLYMLDNRGSGRTDTPDLPYTIDLMADDVKAFIEALHLSKPHMLGHSMGGAIAQTIAYKYPHLINHLILATTIIKMHTAPQFALHYFLKMRSLGIGKDDLFEGIMPWLFSSHYLQNTQQLSKLIEFAESYPYSQSLIGEKRQLEALDHFNSEKWYRKISMPTLIIEGAQDIMSPGDSKKLAAGIPGAQLVTMSDQAHMPHIEKPQEFIQTILRFLSAS